MGILTLNNSVLTLGGSPISLGSAPPSTISVNIDAYWCAAAGCMCGTVYLKCCDTSNVCSCIISTNSFTEVSFTNIAAGCYYVDFNSVVGLDGTFNQIVSYGYYSDCFNSLTESKCTACFSANNNITYELYDALY